MAFLPDPNYVHPATFVAATDGDTYDLRLDFGKYAGVRPEAVVRIRLDSWNAPEMREPGGPEKREEAERILREASRILVRTYKASFERTLADVDVDGFDLGSVLGLTRRAVRLSMMPG